MPRMKMTGRTGTAAPKKKKDDAPVPFSGRDTVQPGADSPFRSTNVVTPQTVVQHRAQAAMVVAQRRRENEKRKEQERKRVERGAPRVIVKKR